MERRVYYADTDAGGVIYHASYLRFFEEARCEFLRERGLSVRGLQERGYVFAVVRLEIDYKAPGFLDDLLDIATSLLKSSGATLTFQQQAILPADAKVLAAAEVTLACLDKSGRPCRIPKEMAEALR